MNKTKLLLTQTIEFISEMTHKHMPKSHATASSALALALVIVLILPREEAQSSIAIESKTQQFQTSAYSTELNTINLNETIDETLEEIAVSQPIEITEPELEIEAPQFITQVKSGDNLSLIFARAGLSAQDVYRISNSGDQAKILSNLYPGYSLAFDISEQNKLEKLEVAKTALESVVFTLNENGKFDIENIALTPDIEHTFKSAEIQDSLFMAAQRGGISAPITMEIAGIFGGVIDFLLDTRTGDTFNVIYEEKFLEEEFIGNGAIQVAQFTNQGETYTALRYENSNGEVGYYNPQGESMRKAFLRNPVDFVRISDDFNPSRKHPILNTIRAHRGTDYAAPRGTPVVATSDGRVTWAARNGSFGKLVVIQHGEQFETKYAHLSNYANGIKKGSRVKQGQTIGYIGSTGSATGPHLHYEFLMNGVHRNYRTIHSKLPKAESIASDEMQRFKEQTQILLSRLDDYNGTNISIAQNVIE